MGQQRAGKGVGIFRRDRNLVCRLLLEKKTTDPQLRAVPDECAHVHEPHRGDTGHHRLQHRLRRRALQGQQRAIVEQVDRKIRQAGGQDLHIEMFHRAVHHQQQVIAPVRHHQVVCHAAIRQHQQAVALTPLDQPLNVDRQHGFQRRRRSAAADDDLTHVGHIEQARPGAHVQMFGHHTRRILNRHGVAREGHHLAAEVGV
ncbi:hypothetical protein JDO7802_01764 [Jannaschia donghaensis]|uniref:Uncharacterized protein n=1 Tax=Jannaschia donghaensis TaxID=420998 RepID=A0A0M6YHB7_9RHOB|nr:hypothetical protein JDO7802_01764 [Jannaschia donghaensis]